MSVKSGKKVFTGPASTKNKDVRISTAIGQTYSLNKQEDVFKRRNKAKNRYGSQGMKKSETDGRLLQKDFLAPAQETLYTIDPQKKVSFVNKVQGQEHWNIQPRYGPFNRFLDRVKEK